MTDNTNPDGRTNQPTNELSRRELMQGASASAAGLAGLHVLSESGAAASTGKRLLVIGRGSGNHTYSIRMESGGTLQKATHAGGNDNRQSNPDRVDGELWHYNVDSYRYTGDIARLEGDGTLSFHFLDGAFTNDDRIVVAGQSQNDNGEDHHYKLATHSADIDPVAGTTNDAEKDRLGSSSERSYSADLIKGKVTDDGVDTHSVSSGDPIQSIQVGLTDRDVADRGADRASDQETAHIVIDPYQPARSMNTQYSGTGRASVVFSYMGDGPFTTFFQNLPSLVPALEGYDQTVLLKHKNLSVPAYVTADQVRKPTRENFEHCLKSLAEAGYTIDLYIMSHGTRSGFKMSTGTFGSKDMYGIGDIEEFRASLEGDLPIELVYQANCWGSELNRSWRKLGATTAVGSRYVNFFPNQFQNFVNEWKDGTTTVQQALQNADTRISRELAREYFEEDIKYTNDWNSQGLFTCAPSEVLGKRNQCAREYMIDQWYHNESEWNSHNDTGWEFMRTASEKQIAGDAQLTR